MTAFPFLIPLVAAIAGIAVAGTFGFFLPEDLLLVAAAVSAAALLLRRRTLFLVPFTLFLFVWGNLSLKPLLIPAAPFPCISGPEGARLTVEGTVAVRPDGRGEGERILILPERLDSSVECTAAEGKILVTVRKGRTGLCTGDRVRFETTLRLPRNYGIPGEFDRVRHLALQRVRALGSVASPDDILLVQRRATHALQGRIDLLAAGLGEFITAKVPGEDGGILRALLLGDRGGISRETENAFTLAGVNHVLSISGFHVAIVGLCLYNLIFFFARRWEYLALRVDLRRLVTVAVVPCAVFYLFLSGAAPATARSVLMIVLGALVLLIERETDPQNTLMVAAAVMLGVAPALAFDISFQLSFLAVWGLVALTPLFLPAERITGWKGSILLVVAASAAATAATAVPVAFHFHRVSLAGIAANLFIIPLLGYGAVVAGFAALPLVPVTPAVAALLLRVAGLLVRLSVKVISLFSSLPALPPWYPTRLDMLLFLAGAAAIVVVRKRRSRAWLCGGVCLLLLLVRVPQLVAAKGPRLRIDFLSVGQAESTLIRLPDGRTMLIDGGGNFAESGFDVGERLVGPALRSLGVTRIDRIVLSHPHPDHLGGLPFVAANFPVGEVVMSRLSASSPAVRPLLDVLGRKGVPLRLADRTSPPEEKAGVRIETLSPPGISQPGVENDDNEDSLVLRMTYGGFSILFTGDIGPFTECRMVREGLPLRATVLKVPHHGSRFSSTGGFLAKVSPSVAVISAGAGNRFGLPAAEAVERLLGTGAEVWRTDRDGTVEIATDGIRWGVTAPYSAHLSLNKSP
jgi:competence protein ComEC